MSLDFESDLSIRYVLAPMELSHLDQVVAIESESYDNPWARNAFECELGSNPVSFPRVALTTEAPPRVAGYCIAWILFEHVHIQNLAVHPAHRRQGLGRLLLLQALSEGRARGATSALLEVRRSNAAAQSLYRRLGFEETGSRREYYSGPREDALVFRKELRGEPGNV
ncbi:MAG TPA: ribosomal protein S18-alanine N-acetyltransferase [Vicinamibacteria bacterium]